MPKTNLKPKGKKSHNLRASKKSSETKFAKSKDLVKAQRLSPLESDITEESSEFVPENEKNRKAKKDKAVNSKYQLSIPFGVCVDTIQTELNNISQRLNFHFSVLVDSFNAQQNLLTTLPDNITEITRMIEFESNERNTLFSILNYLNGLYRSYILLPEEIYVIRKFVERCSLAIKEYGIYLLELSNFSSKEVSLACPIALTITKQPTTCSVLKGKKLFIEARFIFPTTIKLMYRSSNSFSSSIDPISVELVSYFSVAKKMGKEAIPMVDHISTTVHPDNSVVVRIKFGYGTNKKPVCIRLVATVKCFCFSYYNNYKQDDVLTCKIYSNLSNPFIVTTNSVQWTDSEGVLMKSDIFQDSCKVFFVRFVNILQEYYIRFTRQSLKKPIRIISFRDLKYIIQNCFADNESIGVREFNDFWTWFGPLCYKLHHHKTLCSLWLQGYVYGFISKEECRDILLQKENDVEGAFIVRFCNHTAIGNNPGRCSVAFVYMGRVLHYIIEDFDFAGNRRTIDDVLDEIPFFRFFVQLRCAYDSINLSYARVAKESVLGEYSLDVERVPGYDSLPMNRMESVRITTDSNPRTTTLITESQSKAEKTKTPRKREKATKLD